RCAAAVLRRAVGRSDRCADRVAHARSASSSSRLSRGYRGARRADDGAVRRQYDGRGGSLAQGTTQGERSLRANGPAADELRRVHITRGYTRHAEGSVLIEFGDTRVLVTASVEDGVPSFMRGRGEGWITAEYGMLPRATHSRSAREAARGKQSGRTLEIQ